MSEMTCVRCRASVSPQLIDFRDDGAVCRTCIAAFESSPEAIERGERALLLSIGRRQLLVGAIMLALGIAALALGLAIDSEGSIMIVPVGLLLGGLVEIGRGTRNVSTKNSNDRPAIN